jgi:hypothetical protein
MRIELEEWSGEDVLLGAPTARVRVERMLEESCAATREPAATMRTEVNFMVIELVGWLVCGEVLV